MGYEVGKGAITDRFGTRNLRFVPLSRDLMFENGLEVGSGFIKCKQAAPDEEKHKRDGYIQPGGRILRTPWSQGHININRGPPTNGNSEL